MNNLTLNLFGKCNAACKHCCFSCSPTKQEELTNDEIDKIVSYAKNNKNITEFSISGGEPFLNEKLVCRLIKELADVGKNVTCITNGYWAKTIDIAKRKLQKLEKLGLNTLTISYDDYHSEYIDVQNIKNLLIASRTTHIHYALNMAVSNQDQGNDIIQQLGTATLGIPVTKYPVVPVGSAKKYINEEDYICEVTIDDDLRCPSSTNFVIHHDGYAYPCCSPAVFETVLKVGNIRTNSLEELDFNLRNNLIFFIMKKEGLRWFIDKYKQYNPNFELHDKYVSVCHICKDIFKDNEMLNALENDILEYINVLQKV